MSEAINPGEVAERLEALLALREKAELATTIPFQPDSRSWSIAEYCGEEEDLVANSMSFNVAKFFSEAANQSPGLLRSAASLLRALNERVERLEGPFERLLADYEKTLYALGIREGNEQSRAARAALERK